MKIFILCNDGSPIGCSLKTLIGNEPNYVGVGGAEMALLTMCELWSIQHEVVLFNDPRDKYGSPFEQRPLAAFNPNEKCDVLIVFRSPNHRVVNVKADMTVWMSCDQKTVSDFAAFRHLVDKVVVISPCHKEYFSRNYGITDGIVIDLPVRVWEYENRNIEKVKNSFIFTSVPARGLDTTLEIWPQIKRQIPDATLVITSDYRLWGVGRSNEHFMAKAMGLEGITYLSAVPRPQLVEEQLKAEINLYTSTYEELFCVAIAESQVAGAYPITSDTGSLVTTNMGTVIFGDVTHASIKDEFVRKSVSVLNDIHSGELDVKELQNRAIARFHPDRILKLWDEKVFNG